MAIDPKIAMLMFQELQQYGPRLLKALNNQGGLEANPGIEYALESNYDIPLMERKFAKNSNIVGLNDALTQTDFDYSNDIISHGFPSDGNSQLDLQTLSERLLKDPSNAIGDNGQPALMSAAVMQNNPQIIPAENLPELSDTHMIPGTNIVATDADMDDIHSSEMWDNGYGYQHPLKDWYKKNKR